MLPPRGGGTSTEVHVVLWKDISRVIHTRTHAHTHTHRDARIDQLPFLRRKFGFADTLVDVRDTWQLDAVAVAVQ